MIKLGMQVILVFVDQHNEIRALSGKCTHLACTVQYKKDDDVVWCACHNGFFDTQGQTVSGPPPRPLTVFKVVAPDGLEGRVRVFKTVEA